MTKNPICSRISTSKTSGEGDIRKALIEAGLIDCIVNLPANLFLNTQIPAALWFMSRNRSGSFPSFGGVAEGRGGSFPPLEGWPKAGVVLSLVHLPQLIASSGNVVRKYFL
ncbi:N-6 DNA methylase [Dyadobacter jejuensis]|uniref:N-6 DNA methylase n=1 Tax=Dyadobacter jejuensis TaxID=1082580 RepID=UPI001E49D38D|nr:N-6 DNA methylase [Dyadobacter jejuensis]